MHPAAFLLLSLVAAASCDWDLAVLTSSSLELLGKSMTQVGTTELGMRDVSALTYDPLYLHHYFAANGHPNATIFRVQVSRDGRVGPIEPLVKKQSGRVYGLAYDAESTTVFWTSNKQILRSQLDLGLTDGEVIHNFASERPLAIAVEPCSRYIYWSYRFHFIDKSYMDGSRRERVVEGLFIPIAITISQAERRIYWADEGPGYTFRIGRALLDGSNKETILEAMDQQPISLVVQPSASQGPTVYWADKMTKQLWGLQENSSEPVSLRAYDRPLFSVATADSFQHLDRHVCAQLIVMRDQVPYSAILPTAGTCLHGSFSSLSGSCVCTPGYIGALCETSICYNFCLSGTCSMIGGKPVCRCPPGRSGPRCEKDSCIGHCYRGQCNATSDNELVCACHEGWFGPRCNISAEFCALACSNNAPQLHDCRCNDTVSAAFTAPMDFTMGYKIPFAVSTAACGILALLVVVLVVKVCRQSRRPRMKRLYKVTPHKGSAPQPARTSVDCEIAIENCCNMNICETPCYEPELRPPSGRNKKEEKRGLLKEMEVQPDTGNTF